MLILLAVIILLMGTAWVALQSNRVQTTVIAAITSKISSHTGTNVSIKSVNISFFNKVVLNDVYLSDQQKDTLLFVHKLVADIDLISLKNKEIVFENLLLKNANIQLAKFDSSYNFSFLTELFSPNELDDLNEKWKFIVKKIQLKNGCVNYYDPNINMHLHELLNVDNINLTVSNFKIESENAFKFFIESLSCNTATSLEISKMTSEFEYHHSDIMLKNLQLKTNHSFITSDSMKLSLDQYLKSGEFTDIDFDLLVNSFDFGFGDVAFILDLFEGYDFRASFEGRVHGSLDEMHCRDFKLTVGDFTKLSGNLYLNGLPDFSTTYIFFELNESYANLYEIRNLNLPPRIQQGINNMPDFLENVGEFSYRGNFTGYIDDFVAFGTAYSNLGKISTDISFKPHLKSWLLVNGQLKAESLDIGKIFNNETLNQLSLSGNINGTIDYESNFDLIFKGLVHDVDINKYRFNNINIEGSLSNEQFIGTFSVKDQFLVMDFNGKLDMEPHLPVFEFVADVEHVDLDQLNIFNDLGAIASAKIDANFEGNAIDNVRGDLKINNLKYKNIIDELEVDVVSINNYSSNDISLLRVRSDLFDGDISGHYNFATIYSSFMLFFQKYLPSAVVKNIQPFNDVNNFDFIFNLKNLEPVLRVINPEYYIEPDISLAGYYQPNRNSFMLETYVPFLRMGQKGIEHLKLKLEGNSNELRLNTTSAKIRLNDQMNLFNLNINSFSRNDSLQVNLNWDNKERKNRNSGQLQTLTRFEKTNSQYSHVTLNIEPSTVYVSDSLWNIEKVMITFDSTAVFFHKLNLHSSGQQLFIDGGIAEDLTTEAFVKFKNIDFALLNPLIGNNDFSGRINGNATIKDLYRKFMLNLDMSVDNMAYNSNVLGQLNLLSEWDNETDKLNSKFTVVNNKKTLVEAVGYIDPNYNQLNLQLNFDHTPVTVLQVFMPSTFNQFHGEVEGNVHVHGDLKHLMMDGMLTPVTQSGLGITFLNTKYSFSDPVYFRNDSIVFANLVFNDEYGNPAILNGAISHHTFNKMRFNLAISTNNLLVLNTSIEHNEYFYGKGFAKGNARIRGDINETIIEGDLRTEKGTNINIPFEGSENAVKYDFIEYINKNKEEEDITIPRYNVVTSGLNIDLDVDITPDAKVQLIFKSQIGDIIRGEGSGNLKVKIDKNYNINLYGNYIIDQGDYLFTLQNVINKRFSINRGGTIEWVGDPYNALIDIEAVYKVKTSLKDLIVNSYENIDLTRRIQVDCIIKLTENLTQPRINFVIDLPSAEERVKDQVSQLIATPEDVNKQIISLLMMGRFYTPEYYAGRPTTETGVDLVGTTASELISNQLSNWLSQITDWMDVGFNWRPGNEITDDQVEFALSTQILNDRLIINGNIANNTNPNSTNTSDVIGDVDVKLKLTENGRLQLKAYHRSNDYLTHNIEPYTQGIGFTFSDEFNSFSELMIRYKEAVRSRYRKLLKKP